ncbi:unnamed protein product [Paramecium sonneborni]|uniref:Uncharacterized protein n=1 Tax=Paramecium sonneborni TaxID=65129 RepID=A0A8S1QYS3_9CILI|nr:unnamed protein product [Paramecium sonneborni]
MTKLEIGVKQWAFLVISQNPMDQIYQAIKGMGDIYPILKKIEYQLFHEQFKEIISDNQLDYDLAGYFLSLEFLINCQTISNIFLHFTNDNYYQQQQKR